MIGAGDLVLAAIPATNLSIAAVAVPLLVIGAGFKLAVTSITVVAVNSVPTSKAGMASGATSMLRDFGLTLGPAIVGAVALTTAANTISAKIAASPTLQKALNEFYAAPSHVPAAQRPEVAGAVAAVKSGPLGQNGVPAQVPGPDGKLIPFNPLKDVAFHALSARLRHRLPRLRHRRAGRGADRRHDARRAQAPGRPRRRLRPRRRARHGLRHRLIGVLTREPPALGAGRRRVSTSVGAGK